MPPAPFAPVAFYGAIAAIVFGLEALVGLRGDVLVVAPVSLAILGLVQAVRLVDTWRGLRAEADAWIGRGYENRSAARYGWRLDELTSSRERRLLGKSVRAVVTQLSERPTRGAVPLNRELRPCRAELAALADRLEALDEPVSPAGILSVQRLLTEPGSILYASVGFDPLAGRPQSISNAADAFGPRGGDATCPQSVVIGAIVQDLEVHH